MLPVHLGDGVDVTVPASATVCSMPSSTMWPSALDPPSHRLPVRATIANPMARSKPQMFANFTIRHAVNTGNRPDGVTVPRRR
jgi:cobalt-zinc-cadmium efflux system membrane fusion protein